MNLLKNDLKLLAFKLIYSLIGVSRKNVRDILMMLHFILCSDGIMISECQLDWLVFSNKPG